MKAINIIRDILDLENCKYSHLLPDNDVGFWKFCRFVRPIFSTDIGVENMKNLLAIFQYSEDFHCYKVDYVMQCFRIDGAQNNGEIFLYFQHV
jgi:hypothetical protein